MQPAIRFNMAPQYSDVKTEYDLTLGAGDTGGVVINADDATYAASSNAIKAIIDYDAGTCVTTKKEIGRASCRERV